MFTSILEVKEKDNTTTIVNMKNINHIETCVNDNEDIVEKELYDSEHFIEALYKMKNFEKGKITIVMNDHKNYHFIAQDVEKAIFSFSNEKMTFHFEK